MRSPGRTVALGALAIAAVLAIVSVAAAAVATGRNARVEAARLAALDAAGLDALEADAARGETVARAGGCIVCHTDTASGGAPLAGGAPIDTPFGRFVAPNITSDPEAGIGRWSRAELANALVNGRSPDGEHYWPAFPYAAYTATTAQDVADLHAWLGANEPVAARAPEHELLVPDAARAALGPWKARYVPRVLAGALEPRGRYLVEGLGHCAECHARRDLAGGVPDRALSGNPRGPEGATVPPITRVALDGWTEADVAFHLEIGMTPDGDFSGGHMAAVIEHGTAHLSPADREAMAAHLLSDANGP